MWVDGSTIIQHTFESRGRAVGFMRDLLAGRHETCSDIAQRRFAKRRQLDPRVLANYARDAAFPLQVEEALRKYRQAAESSSPTTLHQALVAGNAPLSTCRYVHVCWGH